MIYLDNNATMTVYPQVIEKVNQQLSIVGNADSVHGAGRNARGVVEEAREKIANLVNCQPEQVLFTSGATESNNMAMLGGGEELALVSSMEHSSILEVHANTETIPVDKSGIIDLDWLDNRLKSEKPNSVVVSVMYGSHETGVIQPVKSVVKLCAKYMQRYHMDATQGVGKTEIDFNNIGCQSMAFTAHKIGGVQGIGVLVYDRALDLNPILKGGGQEKSARAGTLNVGGIVGFGLACDICNDTMAEKTANLNELRDYMESSIIKNCQSVEIVSNSADRLIGTSRFIMPNVSGEKQVMFMDLKGICISSASACSSGVVKTSPSLMAMGYGDGQADCSIRVGMSPATTKDEIDTFIDAYCEMYSNLGK